MGGGILKRVSKRGEGNCHACVVIGIKAVRVRVSAFGSLDPESPSADATVVVASIKKGN